MSDEPKKPDVDIDTTINATGIKADVNVLPGVKGTVTADTKDAADVINRVVDKINSAIGIAYEPTHRVRMAKADAQVLAIKAEALANLTEPQQRAVQRLLHTEARKQDNLENIIGQATEQISANAKPEDVDEDFINDWAERASKVADEDMQTLWARLLAGEMNAPGSFRKSALHTVSMLEKDDADLFVRLCQFVINIGEPTPFVSNITDKIYTDNGIDYTTLSHLETIGLVHFNDLVGYRRLDMPRYFQMLYRQIPLSVELPENVTEIATGKVRLTRVGQQLFPLPGDHINREFPQHIADAMAKTNIEVTGPFIKSAAPEEPAPNSPENP